MCVNSFEYSIYSKILQVFSVCNEIVSSCWYKLPSPQRSVALHHYFENELCLIKNNECFDKCKL